MFIDPKRIPSTGNPLIDVEHERLALIINEAYDSWQGGAKPEVWLGLLDSLLSMLADHFKEEEALATQLGYDKVQELADIHTQYLSALGSLIEGYRKDESRNLSPTDLFQNFDRLIYEHELIDDLELAGVFRNQYVPAPKGEPLIEWNDDFLVGEENIDRQHKSLAVLLNRLSGEIKAQKPLQEVVALLKDIEAHIGWHFAYEEKLMTEAGAHGLVSHRTLHSHLLEDLNAVIRDVQSRRYEELEELLENYLKYWLLDHILHVDKAMGKELAARKLQTGETP